MLATPSPDAGPRLPAGVAPAVSPDAPVIALEGVSRRFTVGRGVVDALVGVDLAVRPGE